MSNMKSASQFPVSSPVLPVNIPYSSDRNARYPLRNQVIRKTSSHVNFSKPLPNYIGDDTFSDSTSSSDSSESVEPKRRKRSVSIATKLHEKLVKSTSLVKNKLATTQPILKIVTESNDVIGRVATPIDMDNVRAENINQNQNQNKIKLLKEEPQIIGVQDPQTLSPHQISRSHTQSTNKRKKKQKKTNKLKVELNHREEDVSFSKIRHELANEYYLYCLIYNYHSSLLKKYKNDKRLTITEPKRLNSNADKIQKATSSIDSYEDDAKLADFISVLYNNNNDILKSNERSLLEYSLKHRYLSQNIEQLSNLVGKPNEKRIAEAIDDLISGPEKETFKKLFIRVYKKSPFVNVETSSAANANEPLSTALHSVELEAIFDDFVKNNADDWDFHKKELSDADVKIIAGALTTNKSCTNLDLRHNKITAVGAHYLSEMLCANDTVKGLLLSYNNIGDSGLRYLGVAMANPINSLELLYLNKNGITKDGAKILAETLKVNKSLTDLSLNYNQIGDSGVEALCDVLKSDNTTLKHLYMHGNEITDNSVGVIVGMIELHSALEQIKLEDNQISIECQDQLECAAKEHNRGLDLSV